MKHKLIAMGWICFSIFYLTSGWALKMGGANKPGPGFLPRIVGIGLLILTAVYLWQTFRKPAELQASSGSVNLRNVLGLTVALLAYPVLLLYLNFILATFSVVYAILLTLRYKGFAWDALIAISLVIISFVVFAIGLGVSLRCGPIEEFFFSLRG